MKAPDSAVRDRLALERTRLAGERTLLAYVRTALALLGGGAGALHFLDTPGGRALGWGLLGAGTLALAVGVLRFLALSRRLRRDAPTHT